MKAEDEENTRNFSFSYGKEDVWECLVHTEKELRNVIHLALSEKFGLGWETDSSVGFNTKQQQDLQNLQDIDAKRMHSHDKKIDLLITHTYRILQV